MLSIEQLKHVVLKTYISPSFIVLNARYNLIDQCDRYHLSHDIYAQGNFQQNKIVFRTRPLDYFVCGIRIIYVIISYASQECGLLTTLSLRAQVLNEKKWLLITGNVGCRALTNTCHSNHADVTSRIDQINKKLMDRWNQVRLTAVFTFIRSHKIIRGQPQILTFETKPCARNKPEIIKLSFPASWRLIFFSFTIFVFHLFTLRNP